MISKHLIFTFLGIDLERTKSLTLTSYKMHLDKGLNMKRDDDTPMWPELPRFKHVI
jgi:hypothetical protein